jgi:hypothetical protein
MRRFLIVAAFAVAGVLATASPADIAPRLHVQAARVQERVGADIGYTAGHALPLYLVSTRHWPPDLPCGRTCEPTAHGAPTRLPFHRLRQVDWNRSRTAASFMVPPIRVGRYYLVVYCGGCLNGPRGSLITSSNSLRVER